MKCVGLILVLVFLHSAASKLDNNYLLQTFEDVVEEDGIVSEACQTALQIYLENLNSTTDIWALRSNYIFISTELFIQKEI